jgi:hypothetical protein
MQFVVKCFSHFCWAMDHGNYSQSNNFLFKKCIWSILLVQIEFSLWQRHLSHGPWVVGWSHPKSGVSRGSTGHYCLICLAQTTPKFLAVPKTHIWYLHLLEWGLLLKKYWNWTWRLWFSLNQSFVLEFFSNFFKEKLLKKNLGIFLQFFEIKK